MPNEDPHPESKPTRKLRLVVIPILAAFFILGVLGLLIFDSVSAPPEAEFHGITISEWLKNYHQLKQRDWRETDTAMRSFGTNNIEFILDAFTENESLWRRIRSQILQSGPGWMARFVGRNPPRRLDTAYAPEIFSAIGPSSIPALTQALKDRSPTKQMAAARGLAYFGILSTGSLPQMYRCLSNAPPNGKSWTAINDSIAEIESASRRYGNRATNNPPTSVSNRP